MFWRQFANRAILVGMSRTRARGQNSCSSIRLTHPYVAEIPVPDRGFISTPQLRYAIEGFLRSHDHQRCPGRGLEMASYAFASEIDSDEFATVFREHGARRIEP